MWSRWRREDRDTAAGVNRSSPTVLNVDKPHPWGLRTRVMARRLEVPMNGFRARMRLGSLALTLTLALGGLGVACTSPEYPNCENDSHCQRDGRREWCINRRCQQCRTSADCGPERTCLRNRCNDGENACENDGDCANGQVCRSNRCVAPTECDSARPCATGRRCSPDGRCVADEDPDPVDNQGPVCRLEPPYFAFDNSELDEAARQTLQRDAECLQRERTSRYVLIGRCDARGTTEYNLALGERRARVVLRYLMSLGVLPDRIVPSSEGSEFATGNDEEGWRRDRRVDFRLRQ